MKQQTFVGPIIHTNKNEDLIILEEAAVIVQDGIIISILPNPKVEDLTIEPIIRLSQGQFLIPGFVDCHFHAVQLPNIGLGYDSPLLEWLEKYTFPLERKFSNDEFTDRVMDAVVKRTLAMGTTTICYFASLYKEASLILAQKAVKYGQRAFIGKLNMNLPRNDGYYESTEDSISDTIKFISDVEKLKNPLVKPILTPRFALSCDMNLMKKLGKLAIEMDLPVQTHISENADEVKAVSQVFNEYLSYAKVYDAAGLLTSKTILAHGVYLTDNELNIIKERESSVIHCPSSNACLKSGICDVRRLKSKGIKIGLGTDVGGGQSPSILDSMKAALTATNNLSFIKTNYHSLDYKDVFYLATLGGATCLQLDDKIGNFEAGKQFDALLIDLNSADSPLDNLINCTLLEKLQRFIYSGDDRNIVQVYVNGRRVK
ncbi:guanine deaminase [Leptopilina heterotoma]|uniref:guanine deaminase n=1 Tax=Leptopilina heterotoma TaxID=63436 RepID=UPI001CA80BD3|nr:guanine deaminase [Leptopilina heterotoma]XP_043483101.1 guanine deaminase [Leptopilina heterotoma]XP_043483102.1 guanine deaminase [Leptopilina heterotoma]